jgi:hypothetical protein
MAFLNRCCFSCGVGAVIPRQQNVSKVRPVGDSGGTHYTAAPYPRYDGSTTECAYPATPASGLCGGWIEQAGDMHGWSAQEINDTVDDIMVCGGSPVTTLDHNCYQQSGTVDMSSPMLFGMQQVFARKFWHGTNGMIDKNDPAVFNGTVVFDATNGDFDSINTMLPSVAPQVRFRTLALYATSTTITGDEGVGDTMTAHGSSTVGQYTGIETRTGDFSCTTNSHTIGEWQGVATDLFGLVASDEMSIISHYAAFYKLEGADHFDSPSPGVFRIWALNGNPTPAVVIAEVISIAPGNCSHVAYNIDTGEVIKQETSVYSNTSHVYACSADEIAGVSPAFTQNATATYSDPYTAVQCYNDGLAALAAWDMSDLNLAKFRTDEYLQLAPLCCYDEFSQNIPQPTYAVTMDDYNNPVADSNGTAPWVSTDPAAVLPYVYSSGAPADWIETWGQIPWQDPHNYLWKYGNSYIFPNGIAYPGATLLSNLWQGNLISHTPSGSDRHFWYGANQLQNGGSDWVAYTHGGYSNSNLPPVTMRWLNDMELSTNVFPQGWWHEQAGELRMGKFVQATQKWPATNFGRPCGPDKYAVDQPSVVCINSGSAGAGFVVSQTGAVAGGGLAPGSTNGLHVGDYVVSEGDGIYQITGITGSGPWTITVGAQIDTLPTGYTFQPADAGDGANHLGRLRWPSASGICGRAAITTAYSSPTLTIMATVAQPYLRLDPAAGNILVDVYDASMTLLVSGLALTRVSDTSFTATHAALPTAAWMTGHGVDWTKYSSASQKTGVHIEWTFNARSQQSGYTGGVVANYAGVGGCINGAVTQFNYSSGACPAVVGIVPSYSPLADTSSDQPDQDAQPPANAPVEDFANQVLFDFTGPIIFDDIYGGHWQAAVMLTMPDPFYQTPFSPTCNADDAIFNWTEDNGCGLADVEADPDAGTPEIKYYAHHPLVEALANIPVGDSLPSGVVLTYAAANTIAPPCYPSGIPLNSDFSYAQIEMDYGFTANACTNISGSGRFSSIYTTFVNCVNVPTGTC